MSEISDAPLIYPAEIEEDTSVRVTCIGKPGYHFGAMQLVSTSDNLNDFVRVRRGCGAPRFRRTRTQSVLSSSCYRLDRQYDVTAYPHRKFSWWIPQVKALADNMELWCHFVPRSIDSRPHPPQQLSAKWSTLHVLCMPRRNIRVALSYTAKYNFCILILVSRIDIIPFHHISLCVLMRL